MADFKLTLTGKVIPAMVLSGKLAGTLVENEVEHF